MTEITEPVMNGRDRVRVLHLATSGQLYGAETGLLQLVSGLNRERFSSVVVMPRGGPLKSKLDTLDVPVEIVPTLKPWLTGRKGWQTAPYLLAVLPFVIISTLRIRHIMRRYQVDLVHSSSSVQIDGALAARLAGVPHIWHVRELLVPYNIYHFVFGIRVALRLMVGLSDHLIAVSRFISDSFAGIVQPSRLTIIHNAGDVQRFRSAKGDNLRWQLGIPPDGLLVGQVSRISRAKGLEYLIEASAQVRHTLSNVIFIVAGGSARFDIPYQRQLKELIASLDLEDTFKLLGFRQDVPEIVNALDLMVLASVDEPFGRVLVEGMAAGKPVVATNVGGIPEIIEDGVTGLLVPSRSSTALASAIVDVLSDPLRARQMGDAGHELALRLFTVERYVAEVQKVYNQVLQEN